MRLRIGIERDGPDRLRLTRLGDEGRLARDAFVGCDPGGRGDVQSEAQALLGVVAVARTVESVSAQRRDPASEVFAGCWFGSVVRPRSVDKAAGGEAKTAIPRRA